MLKLLPIIALLGACIFDDPSISGPVANVRLYDCHEVASCGLGLCSIGGNACQAAKDCTAAAGDVCDPGKGPALVDQHMDACLAGTRLDAEQSWSDNEEWREAWEDDIATRTDAALIAAGFKACDHVNTFIVCHKYSPRKDCTP